MLHPILASLFVGVPSLWGQAWKGEVNTDIPALEAKAMQGDPEAMAEYGYHSMRCLGDTRYEPNRIFELFKASAKAGSVEGQIGLAQCYFSSIGTVRDLKKVNELVAGPAAEGHPVALKLMGLLYKGQQGVKARDLQEFERLTRQSAEAGCLAAQCNLATNLILGEPVLDVDKGMTLLKDLHEGGKFPFASSCLMQLLDKRQVWENQDEVEASCIKQIQKYAQLQEPFALFRLGKFHEKAGDLENAVACLAQAAELGSGKAYWALWNIAKNSRFNDARNIWSNSSRDRRILARKAYERGSWSGKSLFYGMSEIVDVFTRRPNYIKRFPHIEEDAVAEIAKGECDLHNILGRLYCTARAKKSPDLAKPEWGMAHLVYHSNHGSEAASLLAYYSFKAGKTTENLARGFAASQYAAQRGNSRCESKDYQEWMEEQMTPEAHQRAEELIADGYPGSDEFRNEAENFLVEIGHLSPEQGH